RRRSFDVARRQQRQVVELEHHVQRLVPDSEHVRERFFLHKVAPELADETWTRELRRKPASPDRFIDGSKWYRQYLSEEVLGTFDEPFVPFNARTRQIYDREKWTGYEVTLDVWPEVFAWGI